MKRFLTALAIFAMGCTQRETPLPTTIPATAKSPSDAQPTPSASSIADPQLLEAPPTPAANPGPAYVLVDHSGVLQITETGATMVFPVPKDRSSLFTEIAVSPTGHLWLSDFQGLRVRSLQGEVSTPRSVKDGPLYEKLVVRSNRDIWAVSSDTEWNVVHYDGTSWKNVRRRGQFPGKYDDNKFSALAVTSDGVWVSSWNGVWRGQGNQWEKLAIPEDSSTGPDLLVYRDQLIVASPGAVYLRKGETWSKINWPENIMLRWVVSDLGLFVAPLRDKPKLVIGAVEGTKSFVESDSVQGQNLRTLSIDGSGRIWVGTEQALAVLDQRGHLLKQWPTGSLDGLTGNILDIAVVGAGPATLPAPKAGRIWDVRGRFVTYKSHAPLANANLALCSSGAGSDCTRDPHAKRITTDARGAFRFSGVPEGEFQIRVKPIAGTTDCESPFTETDEFLVPARDCHDAPGAPGICDLGEIRTCLPFEMPPPPPRR